MDGGGGVVDPPRRQRADRDVGQLPQAVTDVLSCGPFDTGVHSTRNTLSKRREAVLIELAGVGRRPAERDWHVRHDAAADRAIQRYQSVRLTGSSEQVLLVDLGEKPPRSPRR